MLVFRICRGPDWRPGIFVQFTKEGPARDAGLRPGDQLLQCNGVPFLDIPFSEVRPAAAVGPALFAGWGSFIYYVVKEMPDMSRTLSNNKKM